MKSSSSNRSKTSITNGFLWNFVIVVVKTDVDAGSQGVSLVIVETDRAGFSRGRNLQEVGQHGVDTCELSVDVRIPVGSMLRETEGQGFIWLMEQLPRERLIPGVIAVAATKVSIEHTVAYTKDRRAFGKPIFAFQETRFELAECDTLASVPQADLNERMQKHLAGGLDVKDAAKIKRWTTEQQTSSRTAACSSSAATATWRSTRSHGCGPTLASRRSTVPPTRS